MGGTDCLETSLRYYYYTQITSALRWKPEVARLICLLFFFTLKFITSETMEQRLKVFEDSAERVSGGGG
jgi:hypothetical protein